MAKVRSPNYPSADLVDGLALARKAFNKDNRNKMSQRALAKHMGHDSLSGPALSQNRGFARLCASGRLWRSNLRLVKPP